MADMEILLVSPRSGPSIFESFYVCPSFGLLRLAAFMKSRGIYTEYYDPNLDIASGHLAAFEKKLAERTWNIIGFSVLDDTLEHDIDGMFLAQAIRPEALLIAGGMEAQFNYQAVLDKTPCRLVVLGEGEIPLLKLSQGVPYQEIPGIVFKNLATPLDSQQLTEATRSIDWGEVNYEKYWDWYFEKYPEQASSDSKRAIQTIRVSFRNRCPMGCRYCSSTNQLPAASAGHVKVNAVSEECMLEVVDNIVTAHPDVKTIYITDDDFCINQKSVIRFCKMIAEQHYRDLSFLCFARATDLTDDLLQHMAAAGFRQLNIGVETFSQKVLDEIGKTCRIEQVHEGLEKCRKYNLRVYFNIILITPQSTIEDIETSIRETYRYTSDPFYSVGVNPSILPFKGSEFSELYSDFKSDVYRIRQNGKFLRRDRYIYAADPDVRELQVRYYQTIDEEMNRIAREEGAAHRNSVNIGLARLKHVEKLIREMRDERGSTFRFRTATRQES